MEKYGFIYKYFDKKRKMFYIGCHWGTIEDKYICSSPRMLNCYKRRPNDFMRCILKTDISKESLLLEEYKFLKEIPEEELGKKYYNQYNFHFGYWTNSENKLSIGEKISIANKGRISPNKGKPSPRKGKNYIELYGEEKALKYKSKLKENNKKGMKGKHHSDETKKKIRENNYNAKKIKVNGVIYNSRAEAVRMTGISDSKLRRWKETH